jgi:acyl carrier protein
MVDRAGVRERIAVFLKLPESELQDSAVLTNLVAQSLLLVEMVIELQEDFGVRLVQQDLKAVKTVGDLAQLFEDRSRK